MTALQHAEPSIEHRTLALQVSGKLSDAAACYERAPQPPKLEHIRGLAQCYLDLDNVNTALNLLQGTLHRQPDFAADLIEMQAEPLWRLGRYEELEELMQRPEVDHANWGVQVGEALIAFKKGQGELFETVVKGAKMAQIEILGAASLEEGAYQHGYSCISKLHALNELEQVERAARELLLRPNDRNVTEGVISHLSKEWELRIKVFFFCLTICLGV